MPSMMHEILVWLVVNAGEIGRGLMLGMCVAVILGVPGIIKEFKD